MRGSFLYLLPRDVFKMEKQEFNLSEEIGWKSKKPTDKYMEGINVDAVKEFIRLLKENIDKLAGDELNDRT